MRRIITDTDTLHGLSVGFVYNPFDKRLHKADCRWIGQMRASASAPKWHFARLHDAEGFLAAHEDRHGGRPWRLAACCLGRRGPPARPAATGTTARDRAGGGDQGESLVRRFADGFEVWSDEYVRNESRATASSGELRRLIAHELRRLRPSDRRLLHAAYAGERWPGSDVENLLFNNIDQTLNLFAAVGRHGVRFEDLGETTAKAPDGAVRLSYYTYRRARPEDPFLGLELGERLAVIDSGEIPRVPARLAARIWLATRRARPGSSTRSAAMLPYSLRVVVGGLSPATDLKALIDGATAAMQRSTPSDDLTVKRNRIVRHFQEPKSARLEVAAAQAEERSGDG